MKTKVLIHLTVGMLLFGVPLFGMDSSTEEETQSDTELSIGSFIASQVAGSRELLSYGRHAAADLLLQLRQSEALTETGESTPEHMIIKQLLPFFLSSYSRYKELTRCLPRDMTCYIARFLLRDNPWLKYICGKPYCLHTLAHAKHIFSAQFNATGDRIVTASSDHTAKIWDAASGVCLQSLHCSLDSVKSARFNPAGDRIIVTTSFSSRATIWDVKSGRCLHKLHSDYYDPLQDHFDEIHSAEFNARGDRIVTASSDRTNIWNAESGQYLLTLQGRGFFSAQFIGDGNRIVTTSHDNTIKIWDVASGICLQMLQGHNRFNSAQFNVAGDRIVTTSADKTVKIWDSVSGRCLQTLEVHGSAFRSAEFNTRGDRIVTVSFDSTAKIWDVASGECLHILQGHDKPVHSAQFNAAGDSIVTASNDYTAKIWAVAALPAATNWLENECTLAQALLLHSIYKTRLVGLGLRKKRKSLVSWFDFLQLGVDPHLEIDTRFDFNLFPHLQEYFDTMPPFVQKCLAPFVKLKTLNDTFQ